MQVTLITEDGQRILDYKQYVADEDIMKKVHDQDRYLLVLGRTVISFDRKYLAQNKSAMELVAHLEHSKDENSLQFYAPSGQSAQDFINDDYHTICGMIAGNRFGKTTSAIVKMLTESIPCDKSWKIFTEHGIDYKRFYAPKEVGIGTYQWAQHKRIIYPELCKWIPKKELGQYAKGNPKRKDVNWDRNPCLPLECGTNIWFFAYEQDQDQFEGQALDTWIWDEQGQEAKFDGANERTRTRQRGKHIFSLTPHKIPGRPDTGSGSWIHKLASGEVTKGHKVKFYTGSLEDVPDWIYKEEQKKSAYKQWIDEPSQKNDIKKLREGQSRFYGRWHESSGLVYDDWNRSLHLIEPFTIPDTWTRYRGIDHGYVNPTACLCAAVNPNGDVFFYREYYKSQAVVSENCKNIIEMCNNKRKRVGSEHNPRSGATYERYEEVFTTEPFLRTVFDSRSFAQIDTNSGMPISKVYQVNGLRVVPASGKNTEDSVPFVKELLRIDPERKHYVTGVLGAPRAYFFNNLKNTISEIEHYINEEHNFKLGFEKNMKEKPRGKDDHLMDCLRYIAQIPPKYVEGFGNKDTCVDELNVVKSIRDTYTGY